MLFNKQKITASIGTIMDKSHRDKFHAENPRGNYTNSVVGWKICNQFVVKTLVYW